MKIKEIVLFAIEEFIHNFFKQLAVIILLIISIIAFCSMFYMDYKMYSSRYDLDTVLRTGIGDKGLILTNPYENSDFDKSFFKRIKELDCIQSIAGFSTGAGDNEWRNELKDIQNKNKATWKNEKYVLQASGSSQFVFTSCIAGTLELVDLKFQSGGIVKENDKEMGAYYLYLGSDYSDIEVGTRYYAQEWDCDVIVAGILDKGQFFMSEDMIYDSDEMTDSVYSTDCMVFQEVPEGRESETAIMFTVSTGYSMEEAIEEVKKVLKEFELPFLTFSLKEGFETGEEKFNDMFGIIKELMAMVSLTIITIQSCVCISNYLGKKRYYGVLYSNGANNKDIIKILLVENLIIFASAFAIGVSMGIYLLKDTEIMIDVFIKYILLRTSMMMIMILTVSVIVPVIYISRQKTVDLIYH